MKLYTKKIFSIQYIDTNEDLVLTNKEGLVGDVKLKGSLGCSDHEMVDFKILRAPRTAHGKLNTLDFRRADFGLFRDLHNLFTNISIKLLTWTMFSNFL